MSTSDRNIILVTTDRSTADAVTRSLATVGTINVSAACRDLDELALELESAPASAAVVDLDPQPEQMLSELDSIIARFPDVRFVVVCETLRNELLLRAMQAGARQFLTKDNVADQIRDVIDRIVPNGYGRAVSGSIVTVLSAGGGCGATTLAASLAHELQLAAESPSLVIDLDCYYGSAAVHMGVDGMYGLRELLCDERPIDAELVRSTVIHSDHGPHLLMSPASNNSFDPIPLNLAPLPRMLRACVEVYSHVVVDAPRVPIAAAADLARASIATLLVFQCNVRDLRIARSIHETLTQRGIPAESIMPIANRYRRRYSMVSVDDARRALREDNIRVLSNDFASAQTAQNYGQPLAQCAPRSALRRDMRSLAVELMKAGKRQSLQNTPLQKASR